MAFAIFQSIDRVNCVTQKCRSCISSTRELPIVSIYHSLSLTHDHSWANGSHADLLLRNTPPINTIAYFVLSFSPFLSSPGVITTMEILRRRLTHTNARNKKLQQIACWLCRLHTSLLLSIINVIVNIVYVTSRWIQEEKVGAKN